jgi:hypothetical protein
MRLIVVTLLALLWLGMLGTDPGDHEVIRLDVRLTPPQRAMLNLWLLVPYCEALAAADREPPDGMTVTPGAGGSPRCTGTPTENPCWLYWSVRPCLHVLGLEHTWARRYGDYTQRLRGCLDSLAAEGGGEHAPAQ